jgi:hypothetical protein
VVNRHAGWGGSPSDQDHLGSKGNGNLNTAYDLFCFYAVTGTEQPAGNLNWIRGARGAPTVVVKPTNNSTLTPSVNPCLFHLERNENTFFAFMSNTVTHTMVKSPTFSGTAIAPASILTSDSPASPAARRSI